MNSLKQKNLRAQSLVEFALILPLFVLIVMFIFDVGQAVYYYSVLYNAVREGAREAAVYTGTVDGTYLAALEDVIKERAYGLDLEVGAGINISIGGGYVNVEANHDFVPITPVVGNFLPGGKIHLSAETSMRLEFP